MYKEYDGELVACFLSLCFHALHVWENIIRGKKIKRLHKAKGYKFIIEVYFNVSTRF